MTKDERIYKLNKYLNENLPKMIETHSVESVVLLDKEKGNYKSILPTKYIYNALMKKNIEIMVLKDFIIKEMEEV